MDLLQVWFIARFSLLLLPHEKGLVDGQRPEHLGDW